MASKTASRLIDAVLLSVREHGYAGTSMQKLLRDTGVSSSSLYYFFPGGKEELVASAIRTSGLRSAEQIAEVLAGYGLAKGLTLIFESSAREMEQHGFALGCPIGVPATEAPADSAAIQESVAEVFAAWTRAYADALRRDGRGEEEAEQLARFIVASFEGAVTIARATRSARPYSDAATIINTYLARAR